MRSRGDFWIPPSHPGREAVPVLHHPYAVNHLAILENTEKNPNHFRLKHPSVFFSNRTNRVCKLKLCNGTVAFCTFLLFTAKLDVEFFENLQLVVIGTTRLGADRWSRVQKAYMEKNGVYSILSHITL